MWSKVRSLFKDIPWSYVISTICTGVALPLWIYFAQYNEWSPNDFNTIAGIIVISLVSIVAGSYSILKEKIKLSRELKSTKQKVFLFEEIIQSNNSIRNHNLEDILEHIKDNYESNTYYPIFTNPANQLIKIKNGVESAILILFEKRLSRNISSIMAYRIPSLDSRWRLIKNNINSTGFITEDELNIDVKDPNSIFHKVLSGNGNLDGFLSFYNCKNSALVSGNYNRLTKERGKKIAGSIICQAHSVVGDGKTYIETLFALESTKDTLARSNNKDEVDLKSTILQEIIMDNYTRKLTPALSLFFMEQTRGRDKCLVCEKALGAQSLLSIPKGHKTLHVHESCINEMLLTIERMKNVEVNT